MQLVKVVSILYIYALCVSMLDVEFWSFKNTSLIFIAVEQ